jgi:hypothetical protein
MTRTASTQITKPESNTKHCRDQEVAQGSDEQNSTANRTNNRGKTFVVEERVYLRTNNIHVKQRSKKLNNKSIKPFKIKRNIKVKL